MVENFEQERREKAERDENLKAKLSTISVDDLRKEFTEAGHAERFVDGALSTLTSDAAISSLSDSLEAYANNPLAQQEVTEGIVERAIRNYTPEGWVEPIGKTHGSVDYKLCEKMAKEILESINS